MVLNNPSRVTGRAARSMAGSLHVSVLAISLR